MQCCCEKIFLHALKGRAPRGSGFRTELLTAFLFLSAVSASIFGGGVSQAGGNGLFGWVQSNRRVGFAGGLTIGPGTLFSGQGSYSALASHEFGHTLQFIGLSGIVGATGGGTEQVWNSYLGLGLLGAIFPNVGIGSGWEHFADYLGSGVY